MAWGVFFFVSGVKFGSLIDRLVRPTRYRPRLPSWRSGTCTTSFHMPKRRTHVFLLLLNVLGSTIGTTGMFHEPIGNAIQVEAMRAGGIGRPRHALTDLVRQETNVTIQ
jgi:hypothetical protein